MKQRLFNALLAASLLLTACGGASSPASQPERIYFASDRDGNFEIYAMALDGSDLLRLTTSAAREDQPAPSPDGKTILFVSDRDGNPELYKMARDGSGVLRLTDTPEAESAPAWSPDGQKIAYILSTKTAGDLYVMNADGSNPTDLSTDSRNDWSAAWSPDGTRLAVAAWGKGGAQLYTLLPDGSGETRLTELAGFAWSPVWAPDGKSLLFVSLPEPPENLNGLFITASGKFFATAGNIFDLVPVQTRIFKVNADGSESAAMAGIPLGSWAPLFSPDGESVLYVSDSGGDQEIYSLPLSGGQPTNLTNNLAADNTPAR